MSRHAGESPGPAASDSRVKESSDLVRQRFAALERGDRAGWLDGSDPLAPDGTGAERTVSAATFDRMRAMGVVDLRVVTASAAPPSASGSGAEGLVRVDATYRLTGFDTAPRAFAVDLTTAYTEGRLRLASWRPADRPQPWDLDGLRVGRTDSALVLAVGPPARLAEIQRRVEGARARVADVWGSSLPAVWVAPASDADAGRLLGDTGSTGALAAVTDGPLHTGAPAGADRIVLVPTAWDALTGTGRDVVLTHELTHATVRATTTRPVPDWLSEGFAELVAYRQVALAERDIVEPALTQSRRDGVPRALPTNADFTVGTARLKAAYGLALLVARTIADTHGVDGLVRFYRDAAGGMPVGTSAVGDPEAVADLALRHALGITRTDLVAQWRSRLQQLQR
ncbi:MAG: hypothetical protein JWP82_1034 [Humibacillus sp.]|nr:hypothetical protein [Humibacillus sp.]